MWFPALAYGLAAFFRVREKVAGSTMKWHGLGAMGVGFLFHAGALLVLFFAGHGVAEFPLRSAFLGAGAFLVLACFLTELLVHETWFSIFALPVSGLLVVVSPLLEEVLEGTHFRGPLFLGHVFASIAGECFFFLGAISGATYLFLTRKLKQKNRLRAVHFLPPLARLDSLTVSFIAVGVILFAVGLTLGALWSVSSFGTITILEAKRGASVGVLLFYGVLLLARKRGQLSGHRLSVMTLLGLAASLGLVFGIQGTAHWYPVK